MQMVLTRVVSSEPQRNPTAVWECEGVELRRIHKIEAQGINIGVEVGGILAYDVEIMTMQVEGVVDGDLQRPDVLQDELHRVVELQLSHSGPPAALQVVDILCRCEVFECRRVVWKVVGVNPRDIVVVGLQEGRALGFIEGDVLNCARNLLGAGLLGSACNAGYAYHVNKFVVHGGWEVIRSQALELREVSIRGGHVGGCGKPRGTHR